MKAHLQRPDAIPAPPQLQAYWSERRFAEQFNVPFPPLAEWPARKVADYLTIMQVSDEVEAQQQRGTAGGPARPGPAPTSASAPTEDSMQRLRAQAVPPPGLPPSGPPPST